MTGFARAEGQDEAGSWSWEVKSVNGRGLDVRCRLPIGFDRLEQQLRDAVKQRFRRGNVTATLTLGQRTTTAKLRLNEELLVQLPGLLEAIGAQVNVEPARLDGLMRLNGLLVMEDESEAEEEREQRERAILATLSEATEALATARESEGARLMGTLVTLIDEIAELQQEAARTAGAQPESLKARLRTQVAALLEASPALPEDRLVQEAALLAAKSDVREELDRLAAHIEAARELLADGASVGRRLDFLCQEFNREGNTLCSKAVDIDLTQIGLDRKAAVERFREQVQNVE